MGHYDLNRMGWQQFEHMVQALATRELGNGVKAFGSGRDGQRDATFSGKLDFPKGNGNQWNGYGVIQVKHREVPTTTTADWKWFLEEVRGEIRGWNAKHSLGKKTPKYLLFATNISLTGTEGSGGKDQFEALLEQAAPSLGLEGWFAWDYNQIRTLLDAHTEIRQRYLELIVTGDFLAKLDSLLPHETALTAETAAAYTVAELTGRQWVRTGDAGYGDNSKIRLADIAIDLPCARADHPSQIGLRLRAAQVVTKFGNADRAVRDGTNGPQGFVIVGGPGQGKSTLAQVIAHNYRVAFLQGTDVARFGSNAADALAGLRSRLEKAEVPMPVRRRWPIVVELARVGAEIGRSNQTFSLLNYLAESIVVKGVPPNAAALLDWMRSWPVCLVLDGLDEVPSANVRARLLESISTFMIELNSEQVDVLVVATTRPQGYHGEFRDAFHCRELELLELTEEEALGYSEALTAARTHEDPYLADQVTERLISAVHERVTQRLMTTPLQVTIMTALAEEAVELPTDRFELFDRYYKVVYDRELAKPQVPNALKRLRPHINFLHERAGLKLHSRTEQPGKSDSKLLKRELARILRKRLVSTGFDEAEADSKSEELLRVSTERLVMLVSRGPSKFEFEVRSLQEYMAARALTDGEDQVVLEALKQLLPSNHWRNTWLLAAGRLLKNREHLADALIQIITDFDAQNIENRMTQIGAELAGNLYLDDFGAEFPKIRQALLRASMKQFSATTPDLPAELGRIANQFETRHEEAIILDSLVELSELSPSNLATKYLEDHKSGMTNLAKRARTALKAGHRYMKPRVQDSRIRSHMLAEFIERENSNPAQEVSHFVGLLKTEKRSTNESATNASPEVVQLLGESSVRGTLVRIVPRVQPLHPDIAYHAISLLRLQTMRVIRGQEFDGNVQTT